MSTLLKEITKIPALDPTDDIGSNQMMVNLPLSTGSGDDMQLPDKSGFYACSYVVGNKLMFHKVNDPTGTYCKLVLGASLSMVVDDAKCLMPMPIGYNLTGMQLEKMGMPGMHGQHLVQMIDEAAKEATVPPWPKNKWPECVYKNYIPCSIQYEDAEGLKLLDHPEYLSMAFTHVSSNGLIQLEPTNSSGVCCAKDFVASIRSVLELGCAPSITAVHARRILEVPPYVGMKMGGGSGGTKLKTFDYMKVSQKTRTATLFLHAYTWQS